MDLTFDNGQTAWVESIGRFKVERPNIATTYTGFPNSNSWHKDPIGGTIFESPDSVNWRLELSDYQFEAIVDVQNTKGDKGTVKWTQLINGSINQDGNVTESSNGWELDTKNPYGGSTWIVGNGNSTSIYIADSPYVDFNSSGAFEANFRSYIMFKPDTANSIWVPIGVVTWGWDSYGQATGG